MRLDRHLREVVAVLVLAAIGVLTAIVILANQGAPFPSWLPVIGQDRFAIKAQFETGQALTPGQGQTVNLAGVKVGDISKVELVDGVAEVTLEIDGEYQELIHPDASMLLRPRTGLQDMTVQLDGGTGTEAIEDGETIPLASTKPNVNPDQILKSLDADTRAYLKMLLSGGARAFEGDGQSRELAATFKRFAPFARDVAKINGAVGKRRKNLARVIHNFGLVAEEVGRGDDELSQFVDSSNAVMSEFAEQESSLRAALREAPAALSRTRSALDASDRLNRELEPALRELIPSAVALQPALEATGSFFAETTGPVRDQIRPFTRETRESVKALARAAGPLDESAKELRGGLSNLNLLTNQLSYNPPGQQDEGYLFWLAWLNHNINGLATIQDSQGPPIRGVVLLSCATADFAESVTRDRPLLETIRQVTRVPDAADICPLSPLSAPGGAEAEQSPEDGEG